MNDTRRQINFCIGRENGRFLRRLMAYGYNLDLYDLDISDEEHKKRLVEFQNKLKRRLGISAKASDKIRIYNHEFKFNECSICGYYMFSTGCEYCGIRRAIKEN